MQFGFPKPLFGRLDDLRGLGKMAEAFHRSSEHSVCLGDQHEGMWGYHDRAGGTSPLSSNARPSTACPSTLNDQPLCAIA